MKDYVYSCWMAYIPTVCSITDWETKRQFDTIVRKIRVGVSHLLSVEQPGYRSQQCQLLRAGLSGIRTPAATHFSLLQDARPALRSTQTTRWGPEFFPGCQSTRAWSWWNVDTRPQQRGVTLKKNSNCDESHLKVQWSEVRRSVVMWGEMER